ncbi:hypothetical protein FEM48_Zijuj07G0087500 [Ziziphus jujuba var. spinosa]|uniref:DUF569 domain-containing protein n=1 Tax=Ziziphus jujuba var. spinosa TaxID=714518 RepID=A0A978V3M8_ZIZJJ|nr:hypothetical protein FEM48_Zijuj07G0087500 [Ziziphus jujuba var. spinosa]
MEWEPVKCGNCMHETQEPPHGHSFLRANGGLPPWWKTVTHFTGNETPNSNLEWNVDILEIHEVGVKD